MNKINLKLAFRNIVRNKLYTAINIIGLSVASAFCILVYLYVKNERSFDNFHHDQAQLYRLEETDFWGSLGRDKPKKSFFSFLMKDAEQENMIATPPILAVDLKRNFPEIQDAVRLSGMGNEVVRIGDQNFSEKEDNLTYADSDFFSVFNFPLKIGNPATALAERGKIVISERLAKKYFGNANPIGKVITFPNDNNLLYTVGAVCKNFPANSSFQYDMVIPIKSDPNYEDGLKNGVNSFSEPLILKLRKGTNAAAFEQKLDVFAKTYFKPLIESFRKEGPKDKVADMHIYLRPFAEAHYNQSQGWGHYTDIKNIYQLVSLSVIIMLIACLNYILLTLTNAISRSQDVGVRKTIGAGRRQIVLQYYTETQLLAFIGVIVGFIIAATCLPFFSSLTGSTLALSNFSLADITLMLFVLSIILGLLAGIYPALAMSGLKPLNIMRGFSAYRISPVLSKSLVVLQFTICVILVISAMVINKQMHYINQTSMGFNKDEVVVVENPYEWDRKKVNALKETLYNYAATEPAIADITSTSFSFGGYNNNGYSINGKTVFLQALNVDFNYFSFNKIPIVMGRAFSKDIVSDSARIVLTAAQTGKGTRARHNIVINETLYNLLGKPQLNVMNDKMGGVIIGVCKDYHTEDLTKKIVPVYHTVNGNAIGYYWIKIRAGESIPAAMARIHDNWNKLTGNLPFNYTFMDEDVAKSYDAYLRWMTTITTSCILAIIIACLGLFGLSGLTTINRTKEIGIRKVLGASISNLFLLLNRGTLYLAAGSFIIAAPIAFYLVNQWLDNFAYRITPDWELFAGAGLIAMATAVIAVSYHTISAAVANPVKSLRSE